MTARRWRRSPAILPPLAVEQDVERVVALSAVTVQYAAGYRRFADAFKALEDVIKASGLQWTFLRSADYAANTLAWANLAIKSATHEWNWRGREIGRPGLHQPYTYAVCELAGVW